MIQPSPSESTFQTAVKQPVSNSEESVHSVTISLLLPQKHSCVPLFCKGLIMQLSSSWISKQSSQESKLDHVSPLLHALHWLPIYQHFFFPSKHFIYPLQKIQSSPYQGKATAAARAVLPIPNSSACRLFRCPNMAMAASAWDH